jgi:WXG100 family type VII secretion target
MTQIAIDTAQVESTGGQFETKSQELSALKNKANTDMNNLMASFKGNRATKIHEQWQQMQPQLDKAMETLQNAGALLKQAAQDFRTVDGG